MCIENGWDDPDKISVTLAPKIRDMEKRAYMRLKKHVESKGKVNWMNRKKCNNQEEEYRSEVRLWTRIALTATALSPQKKGNREPVKAETSEREMKRKSGNAQGRDSDQTVLAPPPGLYPDLHSVRPPPYAPQQDLQQVQVMVKDGTVEVEIDELDTMNEQIKLLAARLDATKQQNSSHRQRRESDQEGSVHNEASQHREEGDDGSIRGSIIEREGEDEGEDTHQIVIRGTMTMDGPIADRTDRDICPLATLKERTAHHQKLMALRQQGTEAGVFAQTFWTLAVGLNYNESALKDLFNVCLDDPLPQWEMEGLRILDFWGFVRYLHHRSQWATPDHSEPLRRDFPTSPGPLTPTEKRRMRRKRNTNSTLSAPEPTPFRELEESTPEPAPFRELEESTPEPAPFRELEESTPEPAPFRELEESTPEPAPFRELEESAPEPAPFRELEESAPEPAPFPGARRVRS